MPSLGWVDDDEEEYYGYVDAMQGRCWVCSSAEHYQRDCPFACNGEDPDLCGPSCFAFFVGVICGLTLGRYFL